MDDVPVEGRRKLAMDAMIRLGKTFEMRVAALSAEALTLTMDYSDPVDPDIRGIVLATGDICIGPAPDAHIRIPHIPSRIRLYRDGGAFFAATDAETVPIPLGVPAPVGPVQLFLTPEG